MRDRGGGQIERAMKILLAPFSSRYALAGVAGAIAAMAGAGYWYRGEIASAYVSAREAVVDTLGLGVAPVALWAAVFLGVLAYRPSWIKRANLWVGSLFLVAAVLGVLSFFNPSDGPLESFAPGAEASLGGEVGVAIVGPEGSNDVLRAARVLAVFIVGASIAAPGLALDVAAAIGKLAVYGYVVLVVIVKGTLSASRRIYRFEPDSRVGQGEHGAGRAGASPSTADTPEATSRRSAGPPDGPIRAAIVGETPAVARPAAAVDDDGGQWDETASESAADTETGDVVPASAKYNKSWAESFHRQEGENGPEATPDLEDGYDSGADGAEAAPLVDAAAASWVRPSIDLLVDAPEEGITEAEMAETGETIKRTLAEYGVEVEMGQSKPGPTVSMYGLVPGWVRRYKQVKATDEHGNPDLDESGRQRVDRVETRTRVKVDTIMSREKDLSLALKTPSIRIETPVLGESLVGVEVPNPAPSLVALRGVMKSKEFKDLRGSAKLPIAFGKNSGGETVVVDLAQMPHLLVAGSTGSGKSVFINAIVSCLIMEKTPAELRLLLVDPKRVELTPYNGIPHLMTPVVVETDQVVALLKGLIREMMGRYRQMEEVGVRNIDAYNRKMPDRMPYLVVAVDELADLMMSASFDVEQSLCRLAQLGRATGIHLIVATQRPSVDVVTGLIKANFPSRVSFGVTSQIDSRTILDTMGAEKLLGKGDMLYLSADASRPERVQGVFISDKEMEDLVGFWKNMPWAPLPQIRLEAVGDGTSDDEDGDGEDGDGPGSRDELLGKAIELAHQHKKLSTSLLQRRLRIGYPRAARLMDQVEEEGIVGPSDGSKSRDVIIG